MSAVRATKYRLLIVEDEVMIRIFMRDVLEAAGFKMREAANADEALELLQAEEFAAVVSDVEMPGTMTGVDLAWVVEKKWPRTGLVLVSGRRLPSLMKMPAKVRFIAKPCHVEALLHAVREVLNA
jgi:DNA-binding NtrC family response regulator